MILWELFLGFLRVGCFAFGGAYSAIPLIREIVLSYGWLTEDALAGMIAISESTPGPIMVNLATYVGMEQAGVPGAVVATFAVVMPSFVIILLVMAAFRALVKHPLFQSTLSFVKPCIAGFILAAGAYMMLNSCFHIGSDGQIDLRTAAVIVLLLGLMYIPREIMHKRISPILFIAIGGAIGALFWGIRS